MNQYLAHGFRSVPSSRITTMSTPALDPKTITDIDGYLRPNVPAIIQRHNAFRHWKDIIEKHEGGYDKFTKGYLKFGLNVGPNNEVIYREWAPNAVKAFVIGEFSECIACLSWALIFLMLYSRRMESFFSSHDEKGVRYLGNNHTPSSFRTVRDPSRYKSQGMFKFFLSGSSILRNREDCDDPPRWESHRTVAYLDQTRYSRVKHLSRL